MRLFMLAAAACFAAAAVVHAGVLEHRPTGVAEAVIALLLAGGALASWLRPSWTRRATLAVFAVALLGTLAGVFRIAVGLGPVTIPDLVYHLGMVVLLTFGLSYTARVLP